MYFVVLDRYHLGDPLFLNRFARDLLALPHPVALVHGGGEAAERAVEGLGVIRAWEGGILSVHGSEERMLVVRAARELNRTIAHTLTEAGVAAVRIEAHGRGLLRRGPEETLQAGSVDWFQMLMQQRVVPVVAALVPDAEGELVQANPGAVAGTLAYAVPGSTVVCFAKGVRDGLRRGEERLERVRRADVPAEVLPDVALLEGALAAGASVVVTGPAGLGPERVSGTEVVSEAD